MCEQLRVDIRVDIADDDPENERYSDDQLNTFIGIALKRLYRLIGISYTMEDGELTPAAANSSDYDMILLQTECLIGNREKNAAIRKGVKVKQDENSIDTSSGLSAFIQSVSGPGGACALLKEAIAQYLTNGATAAAVTDGENIWSGNRKVYNDEDHDGQLSERLFFPRGNKTADGSEGEMGNFDPDRTV